MYQINPESLELDSIEINKLVVDYTGRKITLRGKPIHLSAREYNLFIFFVLNLNTYISKESINSRVWGMKMWKSSNKVAEVYIGYLRKKMPGCIENKRGVGFRLNPSSFK